MSIEKALLTRSGSKCELCGATESLGVYEVPPDSENDADKCVLICESCREQIEQPERVDANHWRCLN
ncbi:MAG: PhnA protein, partial [Candidatus Sedimenticola sp. (ex Thyasira tokunagai)]